MVRKITCILSAALVLIAATCGTIQAATHSVYENGNLGTTYVTYFKDIVSGIGFKDNYIAFRSGQYSYTMVVGELNYNNGVVSLVGDGTEYTFYTDNNNYNSQYKYSNNSISNFSLNTNDSIIYSDIGNYPQLMERGEKYEMFTATLLCVALLCIVFGRFFRYR